MMEGLAQASGLKQVGYINCAGGGQIIVQNGFAYVGHMRAPFGTTIVDVRDPQNPEVLSELRMEPGTHSHKVRVRGDLMVVNQELNFNDPNDPPPEFRGGVCIYDVSDRRNPKLLSRWKTEGQGVHRYDLDDRYLYLSSTAEGYLAHIVIILDIQDPANPVEVSRWWMPGQWTAGGEVPDWEKTAHRCHHPLRMGDRLYTSYWQAGFHILDIADITKPKRISGLDWSPPFHCPTHTALPIPFPIRDRRYMLVADEDVYRPPNGVPAFLSAVDITDIEHPAVVGTFQVEGVDDAPQPLATACHQLCEIVTGTEIPVAWFAHGVRIVDFSNPRNLHEVAYFVPDVPPGCTRVQSNDVTVDERGLIYVTDRQRGVTIIERV
jgi:hypothetical protein